MEPRIQYVTTHDGVRIGFWTLGEGPAVVETPPHPWSHIEFEWQDPDFRRWYERLARGRMLVRYDSRGSGLSDRDVAPYGLDQLVFDLEAVVDRLGLERFALAGIIGSGPTALAYTHRHPDRVSALVLWCSFARPDTVAESPLTTALHALEQDWDLYTETAAHAMVAGWSEGDRARRFAALMRRGARLEDLAAATAASHGVDLEALLPQIRTPTLILHRREAAFPGGDEAALRSLASGLPNARVVRLEGGALLPFVGDMEEAARAIDEFVGGAPPSPEPPAVPAAAHHGEGLVAILFTDVEGSTALSQRLGDERTREVLRAHERLTRRALAEHGGVEVKTMGDGFMASFASPTRALRCAVDLQRRFDQSSGDLPEPIRVRMGINAGEPIVEERDLFGTPVVLAQRICAAAGGGEILVSDVVRQLVAGKGFLFADRGETALRGFEDPLRLYELRWRD